MIPSKPPSSHLISHLKQSTNINYGLTEHPLSYQHLRKQLTSNGYISFQYSSNSQKKTNHTDTSGYIKGKKLNNKQVTLRTEPHQHKKIQDINDKPNTNKIKIRKPEPDTFVQSLSCTNRNSKKHQHIATEVFNNTGKFSYFTQNKYKHPQDIAALQSKTTTRKSRKQSQPISHIQDSYGHSRIPSFQLKSPKTKNQKIVRKCKSDKKQVLSKTLVVQTQTHKDSSLTKKIKSKKPGFRLELEKIQEKMLNQILELSNFSYGQQSKSQPDLYHRFVQTEEVSFDNNQKQKAVNLIKKHWKIYKKKQIQNMYRDVFRKNSQKPNISTLQFGSKEKKEISRKVPKFDIKMMQNISKQMTISMNQDMEYDFNVQKYVDIQLPLEFQRGSGSDSIIQKEEEDISKIKKKNIRLQKQLMRFKQKQLDLCEKFQSVLLAENSEKMKAEELLELIKKYKTQVVLENRSSSSLSINYKELIEENGIAKKIAGGKNPYIKSLLDNQQNLRKHKMSSKSISEEQLSFVADQNKSTSSKQQINLQRQHSPLRPETKQLLSTYLDCELGKISYQKQGGNDRDLIKESIESQIQYFASEQKHEQDKQRTKQMMVQIARSEQFHQTIFNSLCTQFCEEIEKSAFIVQNLHFLKQMHSYNKTLKIKVSIPDVLEYLKGLIQFVMKNKVTAADVLENINSPLGSTSAELLYYLRPNLHQSRTIFNQNPYQFVIPMKTLEEFQSSIRSLEFSQSQQLAMIHYFWHRSLYELLNELLDKKRLYGIRGKPYSWNKNLFEHATAISLPQMTKIFQSILNQVLEILSFPTGLMFDSPLCQYYQCDLSQDDKMKINQDRMWLIICEQVMQEQMQYMNFEDETAEVAIFLADYIQDLIFFQAVVDLRKLSRQRFLLSI